jgi:ABC-type uncharacterized transport system ATPase subunit
MRQPILSTSRLTRQFGGLTAVDNVSIDVNPGTVQCIIGPNGAGKSTLLNMLCGTLQPSSGQILYDGKSLLGRQLHEIARLGIARKFQVPTVFNSLTVEENLILAGTINPQGSSRDVDEALAMIELREVAQLKAEFLAHGQRQWLEIGMALMTKPRLLLLDEPTAGMTSDETAKTASLIRGLLGQVTVLAIEHDIHFIRALNCHTIVMHQGRILASGSFDAIERNETVRDVYLGRQ